MARIDLDRRFVQCRNGDDADPDLVAHFVGTAETLGWDDLIAKRRVVLLAEAGSGKTTEMEGRAQALSENGRIAFYARVEDVGRRGLEALSGLLIANDWVLGANPIGMLGYSSTLLMKPRIAASSCAWHCSVLQRVSPAQNGALMLSYQAATRTGSSDVTSSTERGACDTGRSGIASAPFAGRSSHQHHSS